MNTINVQRRRLDLKLYTYRTAKEGDSHVIIDQPTIVREGQGKHAPIRIVYDLVGQRLHGLVRALRQITYERNFRTGGLPTNSRIFGFAPRSTLRKDFCSATSLAASHPAEHQAICAGASLADTYYRRWNPELHQQHLQTTQEKVLRQWQIEGSVFTSGIVNKNNPLRYHFDTGNFKHVWSAMLVFKDAVEGGGLSVPEFDLHFRLADHSILMFDGQSLLHGVTPFRLTKPTGYRYSIVYYSLRQMWNCLPPESELLRIRKLKTVRELKRAGLR